MCNPKQKHGKFSSDAIASTADAGKLPRRSRNAAEAGATYCVPASELVCWGLTSALQGTHCASCTEYTRDVTRQISHISQNICKRRQLKQWRRTSDARKSRQRSVVRAAHVLQGSAFRTALGLETMEPCFYLFPLATLAET